jgi:hypothetical protein
MSESNHPNRSHICTFRLCVFFIIFSKNIFEFFSIFYFYFIFEKKYQTLVNIIVLNFILKFYQNHVIE